MDDRLLLKVRSLYDSYLRTERRPTEESDFLARTDDLIKELHPPFASRDASPPWAVPGQAPSQTSDAGMAAMVSELTRSVHDLRTELRGVERRVSDEAAGLKAYVKDEVRKEGDRLAAEVKALLRGGGRRSRSARRRRRRSDSDESTDDDSGSRERRSTRRARRSEVESLKVKVMEQEVACMRRELDARRSHPAFDQPVGHAQAPGLSFYDANAVYGRAPAAASNQRAAWPSTSPQDHDARDIWRPWQPRSLRSDGGRPPAARPDDPRPASPAAADPPLRSALAPAAADAAAPAAVGRRAHASAEARSRRRSRCDSPTRSATAGGPVQKLSADNKSLTPVRGSEEGYCAAPGPHTTHLPFGTAPAGQLKPAADSRASHSGAASAGRDRRPLPARGGDDDDDGDNDSDDSNNNNNITTTNNNNNNNSNNVKGKSGNDNNADDADNVISNIGVRMGSRDKKNNANPISNTGGFNEGSGGAGSARSERFEKEEQPRRQRPAADEPAAAAPQGLADFVIDDDEDDDDDDDDTTHDAPLGTTPSTKSHSAGRGGPSPDNRPLTPDDDLSPAAPKPRRGGAAAAVKAVLRSTDDTSSGEGDTPLSPPLPAEEEDDPAAMSLSGRPAGGFSLARPAAKKARPKLGSGTPLSAADPSVAVAGFGGAGSTLLQASLRSKPSKSRLRKTFDDFSSNDEDSPPPAKEDPFGFKDISSDALAKIAGAKKADDDEFDF